MKQKLGQRFRIVYGIFAFLPLLQSDCVAQIWSTADQFSATNNPSAVWQYGYQTNLGGTFNAYDTPTSLGTPLDYWVSSNVGNPNPNVSYNPTASAVAAFDFVLQSHQTAFHPGPNGEFSIFRWTAPNTGAFAIHADFVGLGERSATDLHVLVNGTSIFDGAIDGQGTTTAFDTTATLTAGGTVDFAVGYGSSQSYLNDTTGINATIAALLQPVPLNIQLDGGNVILSWTNSAFALQTAQSLTGAYTNILGATSPHTNTICDSQRYFRLRAN
jgi:hypothetical protein